MCVYTYTDLAKHGFEELFNLQAFFDGTIGQDVDDGGFVGAWMYGQAGGGDDVGMGWSRSTRTEVKSILNHKFV